MTVIVVPCWWDGTMHSLVADIHFQRPDIFSQHPDFCSEHPDILALRPTSIPHGILYHNSDRRCNVGGQSDVEVDLDGTEGPTPLNPPCCFFPGKHHSHYMI